MRNRAPTQRDVALEANVSQETVSQVLRGVGRQSEETRKRVQQAAKDLGYRRNALAKAIRQGRNSTVALLLTLHDGVSYLPHELFLGLAKNLQQHEQFLNVHTLPPGFPQDLEGVPEVLHQIDASGMLVNIAYGADQTLKQTIVSHGPPSIWLNTKQHANCVYADDFGAFHHATDCLLKHDRKAMAYVDFVLNDREVLPCGHYSEIDRRSGYEMAMRESGLLPRVLPCHKLTTDVIRELVSSRNGVMPAYLLCYGRNEATRALLVARDSGIHVPSELVIVYPSERPFYDSEIDGLLFNVKIPQTRVADEALKALGSLVQQPDSPMPPIAVPYGSSALPALLNCHRSSNEGTHHV